MTDNQNPEQKARDNIDALLQQAGWVVQSVKKIDLNAGLGQAVREYQTDIGPADYVLFVDKQAVGVIEAKKEELGHKITDVENQTEGYASAKLKWVNNKEPLHFLYVSTGIITRFTDGRDPKPRSREVFNFHRPETLKEWLSQSASLRERLHHIPPLNPNHVPAKELRLRDCQEIAITNLEESFKADRPRALIQMATGAGKTYTAITSMYRLLKFAKGKRILFLVDTKNLGEQAEQEMMNYTPLDDNRNFMQLYDYAGHTMPVTDRTTGEIRLAQIFVGLMGASNYTFAEATWSQTLPDWIGSHVRMLAYFGVSPEILVPDNLKSGVSKTCLYEPETNPTYLDFANHYGIAVIPARSRKPRDKAKVENGVLIVERWILACLRNRSFFSLMELLAIRLSEQTTLAKSLVMAELNEAIGELLVRLNQRPFKKLPGCRETMFRSVDYPVMRALPLERYVFTEWKKVRVNLDYHIEVDGRYYSVPHTLIGKQLDISFSEYVIEVLHKWERVASHARVHGNGKRYSTQSAHMPKSHQEMAEWTPERIINWAASVGAHTGKFVDALIQRKPHPQQAFRAAVGIIRLGKEYGNSRVEAACRRACATKAISYSSVSSILKLRLDELPLPQAVKQTQLPLAHDNVRGAGYYH
jgi:transposase